MQTMMNQWYNVRWYPKVECGSLQEGKKGHFHSSRWETKKKKEQVQTIQNMCGCGEKHEERCEACVSNAANDNDEII